MSAVSAGTNEPTCAKKTHAAMDLRYTDFEVWRGQYSGSARVELAKYGGDVKGNRDTISRVFARTYLSRLVRSGDDGDASVHVAALEVVGDDGVALTHLRQRVPLYTKHIPSFKLRKLRKYLRR